MWNTPSKGAKLMALKSPSGDEAAAPSLLDGDKELCPSSSDSECSVYSEASLKREKVRRQIDFASAPSDTMDTNNNGPRSMLKSRSGEERNESPDLFDDSQDLFDQNISSHSGHNQETVEVVQSFYSDRPIIVTSNNFVDSDDFDEISPIKSSTPKKNITDIPMGGDLDGFVAPDSEHEIGLDIGNSDLLIIPLNGPVDLSDSVSDAINMDLSEDDSGFQADVSNVSSDLNETGENRKKKTRKDDPIEKVGRKRKVNTAKWQQNMRKQANNCGAEYVTIKGKLKEARSMEEPCNVSCRYKCRSKLSEDARQVIFNKFWALGEHPDGHSQQWSFIRGCLTVAPKVSNEGKKSRRSTSRLYSFRVKKENIRVCKTMFLATLNVCDQWVETVVKKMNEGGSISPDKRGKNRAGVKSVPPEVTQSVHDHINSIPRVESHYTRKDSSREYLPDGLNTVARLFDLYKEWLAEEIASGRRPAHRPATERQYRDTFNKDFNLGFFLPKKDQCDLCTSYTNASDEEKLVMQASYDEHICNKEKAQNLKKRDASRAKDKDSKDTLCVAAFDYQKVLQTPQGKSSIFYYKRKIGVYNFTIYDIGRHEGFCFVYDQTTATKGPNEVGSFVMHFFQEKAAQGVDEFILYSDNCPSQFRNRFLFAMYVLAAAKLNIKVRHIFLEKGHTHNEGDSMHSVIERKCKDLEIYTLQQWIGLIKTSKRSRSNPYQVIEVEQDMIYDFKDLVKKQNWAKDEEKVTVPWSKIRMVSANGQEPGKLHYHLSYEGDGSVLNTKTKTPGRPVNISTFELKHAYTGLCPISHEKYKDLTTLCNKNAIPQEHQQYYRDMPHESEAESQAAKAKKTGKRSATSNASAQQRGERSQDSVESDNPDDPEIL